ncbi:tRNA lysidine(34) synthetase TilS, partial [bacterium]|nr:tRNA lysidine(34) synthetase TilS [bacterium]
KEKDGVSTIEIAALTALHPLEAYLYELFKKYGFTAWNDIKELLSAASGKEVRSKTHRLVKNRSTLLLTKLESSSGQIYNISKENGEVTHPIRLQFEEVSRMNELGNKALYVDEKTLKYPLTVRKWKNGDYFHPLGMQGKKKLSKYFKDEKVDVIAKEKQWLLCSDDQIVWVIGRRGDNRFKVTEKTKRIIKISLNT